MGKHKTPAEKEIAVRVGARIRKLREMQHISQIRLATDIGIRAGPLGWIEKGKHLPSGRVLYRIARQLNVRLDDLFQETDTWSSAATGGTQPVLALLPPLEVTAPAEQVKAAHIVCQSVAERLLELEALGGGSGAVELPLGAPVAPTPAGAELAAARVRAALGIGDALVSDYLELLERAGLYVVVLELPDGCGSLSGVDAARRNGFVFLNARLKKQAEQQVYRLAFELGRVCWASRPNAAAPEAAAPDAPEALDEASFAGLFAAAFLLPAGALQAEALRLGLQPKDWTLELLLRLKRRCGVPARLLAQRLQALGLSWSDKQKRSPRYYLFKDELDAAEGEGAAVEPGVSRPPLLANGRLLDRLARAEQLAGKDVKALNAVKRVLRQSGVRLDA